MRHLVFRTAILMLVLVWHGSVLAVSPDLLGRVVAVHDGDTIIVLDNARHQTKVRLAEIDAPELRQPYGDKSKRMLSALVFNKQVRIVRGVSDRYGRTIGRVYLGDTDICLTLVRRGGAWAYRQYLTDSAIARAEDSARSDRAGLWALQKDQRIPPWDWRRYKTAPK
jgi:micrococcal nuclease